MKPKAWNYTLIGVTHLFHQMPIILQQQQQNLSTNYLYLSDEEF